MCLPFLCSGEYGVMHDSSLIHINRDNLRDAINLLESNSKVVAISMPIRVRDWWPGDSTS